AEYADRLIRGVYGNPHSAHAPSRNSEDDLRRARAATLAFFDADPDVYDVCFTANTSAAIKLVAESYAFSPQRGYVLSADNHNSVNGVREYAHAAQAPVVTLPLDEDLRLEDPELHLAQFAAQQGAGLFAFPIQSNFSGVKHPLSLLHTAQRLGLDVMIDAAGSGVMGGISLRRHPAEFLVFSFYKIFGLPTGVGALIVKREAMARLRRPWFAGGTVDFVSIAHDRHQLSAGHAAFEDGTPDFLNIGAIPTGFAFIERFRSSALQKRLDALTARFIAGVSNLRHKDGAPLVRIYGPDTLEARGSTIAFNVLHPGGSTVPYQRVEEAARASGVAIRGGCFCNPGAAERAFGFENHDIAGCLDQLGNTFTIPRLQERLGPRATVGALRASIGAPTNERDIDTAIDCIAALA
ncbi:MAG: aminotransferase class V-fold PLP-dependent enzyme, partial [Burkholderiales bacterium]